MTEKLLAYAMGRHLAATDRPHVEVILSETQDAGYRLRDIIQRVVLSEPFRSK